MDVKKDRHFIVQYGKTGTRQKQLYTDDGELQITAKSSNAWVAILREANVGRKEVCRLNMADLKSLVVGNSISLGQMKIYIDSEIESNDMKSNLEVANSANVTKSTPQYSNIPTIKEENNAIKTILSSSGVALPTRKFVLQGSKNLSGLLKPAPSKTMMSAPSKMISNADMKIEASDFINKPKSQSKTIEKENIPNNPVSSSSNSMSLIKISEFKIQSFMLKELKTHQLQAAEFLLTRLRGAPQDPTLESLFQFSSSLSGTWEGYDNSDTEMGGDELDWLEGSKGGGKEKVTETCMSASDQRSEKLYQGAILADEMVFSLYS